jgi:hypothetical protein
VAIKPQKLAKIVTQKIIHGILSLNEQGFMIEKILDKRALHD